MPFDLRDLGNNIKELRKSRPSRRRPGKPMMQFELAERAGIPSSSLCNIENGRYPNPTWEILSKIARALECDLPDLFTGSRESLSPSGIALEEMIESIIRKKLETIFGDRRNLL